MERMMTLDDQIRAFIEVATAHDEAGPEELVELLGAERIESETTEGLVAFVPMAFAHVILKSQGVRFQEGFLIRDVDTGEEAHGLLRDEPIFVAASALAHQMIVSGDVEAIKTAARIAAGSAECNAVQQLTSGGSDPRNIVLTEPVILRLSPEYLTRRRPASGPKAVEDRPRRSWWRFWDSQSS